ncbi:MAG: hypothetical protein Q8911_00015 [Bacillota bacterium]|nr:hypothetical protein [Bacillota bacterium]
MRAEELLEIIKDQGSNSPVFLLGMIPSGYTTGRPTVKFDGESTASTRTYPYLSSYSPASNDRVLLAVVGHGAVIIGKII